MSVQTAFSHAALATLALATVSVTGLTGCDEVYGRRYLQQANQFYRDGDYKAAVDLFVKAQELVPNFPTLWLNKGYTCKQMIIPGSKTPDSIQGAECAIKAFKRYSELAPTDPRGDLLYTQTLFDADRFETLAKMYEERYAANPKNQQAVSGLMQVYTKWDRMDEALKWYRVNVEMRPNDAEAYYSVGTYIYNQLLLKGGGADKQSFDPRPGAINEAGPPIWQESDIQGQQRLDLADEGLRHLEKAIELRPNYTDAMAYTNLLWRQRSFALFDNPTEWQKSVDMSTEWAKKTMAILNPAGVAAAAAAAAAEKEGEGDDAAAGAAGKGKAAKGRAVAKRGAKGKRKGKR